MEISHARAADAVAAERGGTFTGRVYGDPIVPSTDGILVNTVVFAPGARTFWHTHEKGQLLVVVAGAGFVRLRHGEPQPIRTGDVIWFAPDEEHWHGAGPDSILTHIAISLGDTRWLEEVSDADYVAG